MCIRDRCKTCAGRRDKNENIRGREAAIKVRKELNRKEYPKAADLISGDGMNIRCKFGCPLCAMQGEQFCLDGCGPCRMARKEKEKEIGRELIKGMRVAAKEAKREKKVSDTIYNDRYICVTLTGSPEWGSRGYLKEQFLKNWMRMTPASTNPIASAYVMEDTGIGTPHLHGMIRYRSKGMKISEKMSIYKNYIQVEGTSGVKNKKEGRNTIENISIYDNSQKIFITSIEAVKDKYEYMEKYGKVKGDKVEVFIRE